MRLFSLGLFLFAFLISPLFSRIHPIPQHVEYKANNPRLSLVKGLRFKWGKSGDLPVKIAQNFWNKQRPSLQLPLPTINAPSLTFRNFSQKELHDYPKLTRQGSYILEVTQKGMTIASSSSSGFFYAIGSLCQIIQQQSCPILRIVDFPIVSHRGVVEGFYGNPWSFQARCSQLAFYGKNKLNTYIYGPKDDPYHSSPHWRKPYPPREASQIAKLAQIAKENAVDFYWAIHPGKDIDWSQKDIELLLAKCEAMYQLGVRAFAVFFDDISGKGTNPKLQAQLLNTIQKRLVEKKGDIAPLIVCPTEYNRAWANPQPGSYLDILGKELDPKIFIMWTGNSVVDDLDAQDMQWINARLQRQAFIWWNFPVSDYVRDHLLLGAAYGNTSKAASMMSGFVSNPMDKPEASKIALYGVASYAWNPQAYDAQKAWERGIQSIIPQQAQAAYRTFAMHHSDLGKNGHGYRREESALIAPALRSFLASYQQQALAVPQEIRTCFTELKAAPPVLLKYLNPALTKEIHPWLIQAQELGHAGVSSINTTQSLWEKNLQQSWTHWLDTQQYLQHIAHNDQTLNQNPYQPGVKSGSLHLMPFVRTLHAKNADILYSMIAKSPILRPRFTTSFPQKNHLERAIDSNPESFYESKTQQKKGDWVALDLQAPREIHSVHLLQGRNRLDWDIIHEGQLESSLDGKSWKPLGNKKTGAEVFWNFSSQQVARFLRYRVTHAGKLDGSKPDVWTRIALFEVNPAPPAPHIITNIKALSRIPLIHKGHTLRLPLIYETITWQPHDFLTIDLGKKTPINQLQIQVESPTPFGRFSFSEDGKHWQNAGTVGQYKLTHIPKTRFIRFAHEGKRGISLYFKGVRVETQQELSRPTSFVFDQSLSSFIQGEACNVAIPSNLQEHKELVLLSSMPQKKTELIMLYRDGSQATSPLTRSLTKVRLSKAIQAIHVRSLQKDFKLYEIILTP